jgi:hypothetical protein
MIMADFDRDNYKSAEFMVVKKQVAQLSPLLDRINVATTLRKKIDAATNLAIAVRKGVENDLTGLKKPAAFTVVSERFYNIGRIFAPSANDKMNAKAANFFFRNFKDDFLAYAFDRATMPKFNSNMIDRHLVALVKMARTDPKFRKRLIKKIEATLRTKKGKADRSVSVLSVHLPPLIKARELVPLLRKLANDKTLSESRRKVFGASLKSLQRVLATEKRELKR